LCTKIQN